MPDYPQSLNGPMEIYNYAFNINEVSDQNAAVMMLTNKQLYEYCVKTRNIEQPGLYEANEVVCDAVSCLRGASTTS
jgi:hypothetical protein